MDDRCHLHVYYHPPRVARRLEQLPKGFSPFKIIGQSQVALYRNKLHGIGDGFEHKEPFELLRLLLAEVKANGFAKDLNGGGLLGIADEKLKHPRHRAMRSPLNKVQMLALLLLTSLANHGIYLMVGDELPHIRC